MFISIYQAIAEALDGQVEHVALWNRNVEFAEQEMAWPRPAAFIEFEPVEWVPNKEAEPLSNLTLASRVRVDSSRRPQSSTAREILAPLKLRFISPTARPAKSYILLRQINA